MRGCTCMRATGATSCCSFSSPCAEMCAEELSNIAHPHKHASIVAHVALTEKYAFHAHLYADKLCPYLTSGKHA